MDNKTGVLPIPAYAVSDEFAEGIENRFTFHPITGESQKIRYEYLRTSGKNLANDIMAFTPQSREQSVALTKLQEAIMWANAAIAINEKGEN